jgi:hypothetical protein
LKESGRSLVIETGLKDTPQPKRKVDRIIVAKIFIFGSPLEFVDVAG